MNIILAADHNGFEKKKILFEFLRSLGYSITDAGNRRYEPEDDFPDYVESLVQKMRTTPNSIGVVMCGSGVGTSIAANKYEGIFCALCSSTIQAKMSRMHAHANVLALSASYTQIEQMKDILLAFIKTNINTEQKYIRRVMKIKNIKRKN